MDIHKNARLTPVLREQLAQKVLYDAMMLSTAAVAFNVSTKTAAKWVRRFQQEGRAGLLDRSSRPHCSPRRLSPEWTDDECKNLLFSMLHRPPREFGINRTSWRLVDLHRMLREQGQALSGARIKRVIKSAGFKWRKAKIVLTSTDPDYTKKVEAVKKTLATLRNDEAFFSIDEFGPFAIKKRGGRKRVGPGEYYVIPQWQRSKGWLILTAALELSSNRVVHFYSRKKNTDEMIRMAVLLRSKYRSYKRIYLSWDAASWHISKKLKAHLEELNE